MKTAMEIGIHSNDEILQVKTNSRLYPKQFIEDALAGIAPNEQKLIAVSYHYSCKTTLFFVMTVGIGSTKPGHPYIMTYTDGYGNLCTQEVECPEVTTDFFECSNTIDQHNQSRQFGLRLEKSWVTKDCFFCLTTMLLGINMIDAWKLTDYHKIINYFNKLHVCRNTWLAAYQKCSASLMFICLMICPSSPCTYSSTSYSHFYTKSSDSSNAASSISDLISPPKVVISIQSFKDVNGIDHHQLKLPLKIDSSGWCCTQERQCRNCKKQGG